MMKAKNIITIAAILLGLAVLIGAFGAHGLKSVATGKYLETYKTGVTYHFYHGFALLALGLLKLHFESLKSTKVFWCFLSGIILFSFNCYFYAITQAKTFAMIVPIGGILFVIGWFNLAYYTYKVEKK